MGRWKDRIKSLGLLQKEDIFKDSCFMYAVGTRSAAARGVC